MADGRPAPDQDALSKIDTTVPHSARIWNYWMGGKDNYEVDRVAGDAYREVAPNIETMARASRDYLIRTVTFVAGELGIRQFLDIGTGLPTYDNTHQVAQRVAPESRIVYVDNDPLVLRHAQALLTSTPEGVTDYIDADLHEPEKIIETASRILDFSRPVALMLMGILGHIQDYEEAKSIVRRLQGPCPRAATSCTTTARTPTRRSRRPSRATTTRARSPTCCAAPTRSARTTRASNWSSPASCPARCGVRSPVPRPSPRTSTEAWPASRERTRPVPQPDDAGSMFWLRRNRLAGSRSAFTRARRA